ncbi:iron-containing alcohol dehydrogenase [Caldicellulosiruptoraceae bacterium PP1]
MITWLESIEEINKFLRDENILFLFDKNTFNICGKFFKNVEKHIRKLILPSNIHADEKNIGRVFFEVYEYNISLIFSVGSGTLTDIARYVSAKTNIKFFSFPTAPSMDGYASSVAALTIDGIKTTVPAKAPNRIFIYLPILKESPMELKRAGFGDLIGKITALLDWRISNILFDEKLDEDIFSDMKQAYLDTLNSISSNDFEKNLIDGLIKSGLLMKRMGNSRPASGSEHHISHYLEYKGYDNIFHGIKVGIATIIILKLYNSFLHLSKNEIKKQIGYNISLNEWQKEIQKAYPDNYIEIINANINRIKVYNDEGFRKQIINKIIEKKDEIDDKIKESIILLDNVYKAYEKLGFSIENTNIKREDLINAILYADNIRDRFTILQLLEFLGFLNIDWLEEHRII